MIGSLTTTPSPWSLHWLRFVNVDSCPVDHVTLLRRPMPAAFNLTVLESLIVALVLSRLEYCNNILSGLPASLIQRLKSVLNAAARPIFGLGHSEHITTRSSAYRSYTMAACFWADLLHSSCPDGGEPSTAMFLDIFSRVSLVWLMWHLTTGVVLCLSSSVTTVTSFLYGRQASYLSYRRQQMERPSTPCHICTVTCGYQTALK